MTSQQKGIGPSKNLEILLALWNLKEDDTLYLASDIAKLMYDPITQKSDYLRLANSLTKRASYKGTLTDCPDNVDENGNLIGPLKKWYASTWKSLLREKDIAKIQAYKEKERKQEQQEERRKKSLVPLGFWDTPPQSWPDNNPPRVAFQPSDLALYDVVIIEGVHLPPMSPSPREGMFPLMIGSRLGESDFPISCEDVATSPAPLAPAPKQAGQQLKALPRSPGPNSPPISRRPLRTRHLLPLVAVLMLAALLLWPTSDHPVREENKGSDYFGWSDSAQSDDSLARNEMENDPFVFRIMFQTSPQVLIPKKLETPTTENTRNKLDLNRFVRIRNSSLGPLPSNGF